MKKIFSKLFIIIAFLFVVALTACGNVMSQVKIEGTASGEIAEGTKLVYTLNHKEYVHGQKVADALRFLPDEINFTFEYSDANHKETWLYEVPLSYYVGVKGDDGTTTGYKVANDKEAVEIPVTSFVEGGDHYRLPIVIKVGEEDVVIGSMYGFEKLGSSENTYGYTNFEINAEWIDTFLAQSLTVSWLRLNVSLSTFKYTKARSHM